MAQAGEQEAVRACLTVMAQVEVESEFWGKVLTEPEELTTQTCKAVVVQEGPEEHFQAMARFMVAAQVEIRRPLPHLALSELFGLAILESPEHFPRLTQETFNHAMLYQN